MIGANCHVEQSIIGAGVQIKEGSRVPKGCLIADGVVIGPNATLEPFERLSLKRDEADNDSDEDSDDSDVEEAEASVFLFFLYLFPPVCFLFSVLPSASFLLHLIAISPNRCSHVILFRI